MAGLDRRTRAAPWDAPLFSHLVPCAWGVWPIRAVAPLASREIAHESVSTDLARKQRILAGFRGRTLLQAIADPALRQDMEEEARSTTLDRLVTPDLVAVANAASRARQVSPRLSLFAPVADVIVLPGLLASQLTDTSGGNGLIWINPTLIFNSNPLLALGLKPNNIDQDSTPGVSIQPDGAIPVVYAGLRAVLEFNRFHVVEFGFDWRKNFDESAAQLADVIRDRANQPSRPLHLVAHSQAHSSPARRCNCSDRTSASNWSTASFCSDRRLLARFPPRPGSLATTSF
jgi:hypothetical protein